jgi:hypothetical protein
MIAVLPVPYGYFLLLRLVTTALFAWIALESHGRGQKNIPWIFGGLTLLFNPIIKVHFSREIWNAIDVLTAIFLFSIRSRITESDAARVPNGK